MDKFSFFFAFYGLILGLAVTELLSGFAGMIRARALKQLELQTGLLALLTFILICATWIDAWSTEQTVSLDFRGLWAPILIGTFYYLAAAIVFPRDGERYDDLATYYAERKRFVVGLLIVAELLNAYTYRNVYLDFFEHRPAVFWLWNVPYKLAILGCFSGLWIARTRRANAVLLIALLMLFSVPYWGVVEFRDEISRHFYGYY